MTEMKSKVKERREHYEPRSVAWMEALRNFNKTKKVYDIDPYAEVYQFRENVYGILTDNLDGGYCSWIFLINGPEKSMLIDTGWGLGDLKGLAEKLNGGKPLIVVNTHYHMDHAYGNCQFDKVYCHKYGIPYLKMQNPHMWDYVLDGNGSGKWVDFDAAELLAFRPYEMVGCENHHIFNLGEDYDIEMIWLPGHTPGGAGFLDKKNRILFSGDAYISMRIGIASSKTISSGGGPNWLKTEHMIEKPYVQYATVRAFRDEAVKLAARTDEFDSIFPGHFILDIDSWVVESTAKALNEIVADPSKFDYEEKRFNGVVTKFKMIQGLGTIAYLDDTVADYD